MLFCFLVLMANCLSFIFHAQVGSEAKGHHLNLMTLEQIRSGLKKRFACGRKTSCRLLRISRYEMFTMSKWRSHTVFWSAWTMDLPQVPWFWPVTRRTTSPKTKALSHTLDRKTRSWIWTDAFSKRSLRKSPGNSPKWQGCPHLCRCGSIERSVQ